VGGTNTGTTVLDGSVRAGELAKIVACHLWLYLDRVEDLSVVYSDNRPNHLGHHNHVPQVRLDNGRLLIGRCLLLGLAQFFDEAEWSALETTLEASAGTGVDEVDELFVVEVEKLVEFYSTVGKCPEGPSLLELGGDGGVGDA